MQYQKSAELLSRAEKVLAGGVSSEFRKYNYPHALFYTHGQGSYVYDVDGNRYLDFTLSQGPLILGHSHPEVLQAVEEYSRSGQLFAGQHLRELELAELLTRMIPCAELSRFCLDGSTAVQTAFRIARAKTGKSKFLRFEGHYHGWLDNVCFGLSASDMVVQSDRMYPDVWPWTEGLPTGITDEFVIIPWNDKDLLRRKIAENHEQLAAVITEPIMCNNGCILPEEGYLEFMRELCDEYKIALIFDEVITGFRTSLGGAQSYFNVIPDLAIFAKAMASGYPLSVITGKRSWMEMVSASKVIHAGTMNSSSPTVAAALATIQFLERTSPYENMYRLGKRLMAGLETAANKAGVPVNIQGPGPMFNLAFTAKEKVKEFRDTVSFNKSKMKLFIQLMQDRGVRIISRGLWYISAVHTEEEIDIAITAASESFGEMSRTPVEDAASKNLK